MKIIILVTLVLVFVTLALLTGAVLSLFLISQIKILIKEIKGEDE